MFSLVGRLSALYSGCYNLETDITNSIEEYQFDMHKHLDSTQPGSIFFSDQLAFFLLSHNFELLNHLKWP